MSEREKGVERERQTDRLAVMDRHEFGTETKNHLSLCTVESTHTFAVESNPLRNLSKTQIRLNYRALVSVVLWYDAAIPKTGG